ncbi:SusD/RagB family nutrient-binding outer membrane lipoprotein [Puia sp.]|uniref:SusD/RagB family nutrient-binding outer membrane lipoprotein n=1 Tax=Puia sp. TaxID=2045100 RepID=UPI002F414406
MKTIYKLILGGLLLGTASCKKELANINKNPNATENPQPDYLLTAAEKLTADAYWGVDNNLNSSLLFIQHWAKIQYTDPDRYIFNNSSFTTLWSALYGQSITDLNKVISIGEEQQNNNYKGVALTLRSWAFQILTDAYGDIPYKQANNIDSFLTPAYDAQRDVYLGLLADLKTAQTLLDPAGPAIQGDAIYGGNIVNWKKFVNALRVRIALRIADQEPTLAKQVFTDIQTEAVAFFESNADLAALAYQDSPNQNPVSLTFDTRQDYRISKTIVDRLSSLNDPRLPVYAQPTDDAPHGYVGVPNGLLTGDANNLGLSRTSRPGDYFRAPHAPAVIMSYAEILFDLSEAVSRGFITGDAADLYKQGVLASLAQYGITDATVTGNYLGQASVQYNAGNYKKSVGDQKWIALYGQGLEAFAEWRRLDYPQLTPAVAGTLGGKMPVRFIYPGSEQSLNGTSYKAAVAHQGADLLTTKLWFDKN